MVNASPAIAVIGSNMIDLVTKIERMPRLGETTEALEFSIGFGGKGANQAVASARLGADVVMVTRVGDDMFGPGYKKNLAGEGIDVAHVLTAEGMSNGVAPIFVDREANNSILIVKGANKRLSPADVDAAAGSIRRCGLIVMQLEVPLETVYHAAAFGRDNGIPVILNPAPAAAIDFAALGRVAWLVPNETELEALTGMPATSEDEARRAGETLLDKGCDNLIVTLGAKGAMLLNRDGCRLSPPSAVRPVDTTGAGDAFIASFSYHLLTLGDVDAAMAMANKYAALSTTRPGTQTSFPTGDEFSAALRRESRGEGLFLS